MLKPLVFGAVMACLAGPLMASDIWRCDIPSKKVTDFLGGPVIFLLNAQGNGVQINNPMINHFYKKPLVGKLGGNTDKVLRVSWVVNKVQTSKGDIIPTMRYSAVIQKASGAMVYYARSPQYDDSLGTNGTCKRVQ